MTVPVINAICLTELANRLGNLHSFAFDTIWFATEAVYNTPPIIYSQYTDATPTVTSAVVTINSGSISFTEGVPPYNNTVDLFLGDSETYDSYIGGDDEDISTVPFTVTFNVTIAEA